MNIIDFDDLLDPGKPVVLTDRNKNEYVVDAWVPARASIIIIQNLEKIKQFMTDKKVTDEVYVLLRDVCVLIAKRQHPFMDADWFEDNVSMFRFAEFAGKIVWQALDFMAPTLKQAMKEEMGKVQVSAQSQSGSGK